MIMQLELVTKEMVHEAIEQVRTKKNPVSLPRVKFESFEEGKIAQIMHIGPFSEECPNVEKCILLLKKVKAREVENNYQAANIMQRYNKNMYSKKTKLRSFLPPLKFPSDWRRYA